MTFVRWPAAAAMPWNGVTTRGAITEVPPPLVTASLPASSPMTAIDRTLLDRGRMPPEFFKSTVPSSATVRATVAWAGEVTMAPLLPLRTRLKRPNSNMVVSTRVAISWSVLRETAPSLTAISRGSPKKTPVGPSMSSSPALAAATVEWVAPPSDWTYPPKFHWPKRILAR